MKFFSLHATVFLLLPIPSIAFAEFPEITNSQAETDRPITAQEAVEKFTVPRGFDITLFAGEPNVHQPIAMSIDDRGRVWVAECYTYEGRGYDYQMKDRVVILEDTNHDGKFDKRKVFWDQGVRLTGLMHGFNGLWILNDGRLEHLSDTNGDDLPDGPATVHLNGFTPDASHNVVNGLLWGPDGWLYGRHGILATSTPGTPATPIQKRQKINCGIWRYHPVRKIFEPVVHGTTNPWGMDYNDYGEFFFTNNVIGHLWHVIPGAHFKRMYGDDFNPYVYELIDQHADHYHWDTDGTWVESREGVGKHGELGGGHSHCGGMIYLADNWPAKYRNRMFMFNTHGRRVNQNILEPQGSGYVGKRAPDMLFANQPWFRGVSLKYGPDGGVYLSDWADLGECHDADGVHRTSGRIYKVTYGEVENAPAKLDVSKLKNDELVRLQLHKNDWYVRHARRVLQERAAAGQTMDETHEQLRGMYRSNSDVTRRLRALWALYVSGGTTEEWLHDQLADANPRIRVWAIRLLSDQPISSQTINAFNNLAKKEESKIVKLYLVSALQKLPLLARIQIAQHLINDPTDADDHNLPLMLWYGIEPAVPENAAQALAVAMNSKIPKLRELIARRLTTEINSNPRPINSLIGWLAQANEADQLDVLTGMTAALQGWRKAPQPASWATLVRSINQGGNDQLKQMARDLSVVFGDGRALKELFLLVDDNSLPTSSRKDALDVLLAARADGLQPVLKKWLTDRELGFAAIRGLAVIHDEELAKSLVENFDKLHHNGVDAALETLSSRPDYAIHLLKGIQEDKIKTSLMTPFLIRQIASFESTEVQALLDEVWGTVRSTPEDRLKLIQDYHTKFNPQVLTTADASKGRVLFEKTCASCHKLFGTGGEIGPDITGANRDNLTYLLDNIIDPSALVAKQFRMSIVELEDGRILTGVVSDLGKTYSLQTAKEKLVFPKSEVTQIKASTLSLMPDGLLEKMSEDEIANLIAYLMSPQQVQADAPTAENSE
ncbi:MAG: dehydrogenase [Blastopirellula sp.]|nr:MAG: dehydrogenase [Blastopirellula sp.]